MSGSVNQRLNSRALPSFLKSRGGWGQLFELKRSPFPHLHQIEPTNACPYHCIMCPRGDRMRREIGYMPMHLFRKVIDETVAFPAPVKEKEVELIHFGESLLHPRIADMNEYAAARGLFTVLSVNAPELTESLAAKLVHGKAGRIIVSMDGFDANSYQAIRGRRIDFQRAVDNILAATELIRTHRSSTGLVVRMISLYGSLHKTSEFETFWREKGISSEIREFFPWGEPDMRELGAYDKYPPFMPCPFAWQYLVVQWNGDVVACCRDYNGENVMGNVKEAGLVEIWNGKKYAEFRENMVSGKYQNRICKPCMDLYYTEES
jgi:radical SAM protein with 4Fe4S-binding SPASM domain